MQLLPCSAFFVGGEILDLHFKYRPGRQVRSFHIAGLQSHLLGHYSYQVEPAPPRSSSSGRFLRAFRKAQRLQDIAAVSDQFRPSPLVGVFEGGFRNTSVN